MATLPSIRTSLQSGMSRVDVVASAASLYPLRTSISCATTCLPLRRCYSTSPLEVDTAATPTGPPESYVSLSTDPFFNLAFEDHLFRTRPSTTPVCLIYRNTPCVVVGRNQNPWKELNASAMRSAGIPVIRRQSGGGTVYHDLGNTNYSFHIPRESFDRRTHAELVARALNVEPVSLGSPQMGRASAKGAYVNARGDICVSVRRGFPDEPPPPPTPATTTTTTKRDEDEWEERKISGSAYKLVNTRAYHHGTLLLSASLSSLGSSLHNSRGSALVSKGVASVRAKVTNLTDAYPDRAHVLDHDTVARAVVTEFWQTYAGKRGETELVDERVLDAEELNEGRWKLREMYQELRSWEWVWGQTPEFTHRLTYDGGLRGEVRFELDVHSKNGVILDLKVDRLKSKDDEVKDEVKSTVERLKGQRYDEYAVTPPWTQDSQGRSTSKLVARNETEREIFQWLREVL